jgi:hypothetical protein
MKLTQVDLLAEDLASIIQSEMGDQFQAITRKMQLDSTPSLRLKVHVGAPGWQAFDERRVVKLQYASANTEVWEVQSTTFERGGAEPRKTVTCRPLWMRLDDQIAYLLLTDGTKDVNLSNTSVTVSTALTRVLSSTWQCPSLFVPGNIESAFSGAIVNTFRSGATHKEHLEAIVEDLRAEFKPRWDEANGEYEIDVVERIGDEDATARTIRETPQSTGEIVNRLQMSGRQTVDRYFSGVVPLGGQDSSTHTMEGARWPIASVNHDSNAGESTVTFEDEPIWDDGVLTNEQVTDGNTTHDVLGATAPDQITVSGDLSGWDTLWFVDAMGHDLITLRDPAAESQIGRRTVTKRFSGVTPFANLLERAGVSTAADSQTGWAKIGSNTLLNNVTGDDFVRNGDQSIEVVTSASGDEEGIRTASFDFQSSELGEVVSAHVSLYVKTGRVQVQLVDSAGKEYPSDETIEGGESTIRGYSISGAKPADGSLFVKVVKLESDTEFVVDAASIVASASARGYSPNMGPRALWRQGAKHLLRSGGVPERTFDGTVIDLSELNSTGQELTLGDATTVITHDGTSLEGRITSTERQLVVGSPTVPMTVRLGEPVNDALDRFFDEPDGTPPSDDGDGTSRVQPVLTDVVMDQSGNTGELTFSVSDPLGVVQKVRARTADGRNLDSGDSYQDLSPVSGSYTETVGLSEGHNSYIQVRLVTGPQVDDVERVFAFDRDRIPEADYNLKWSYNASRDAVEARIVAVGDEDTASYRFGLDTDRDGTDDEVVTVDTRAATQLLNPNVSLTPGSKVNVSAKAFSKAGQAGNEQPEPMVQETFEVPRLSGTIPQARPTLNATPNQSGDQGELKWTVDDPADVVNDVLVRTASGRNLTTSDAFGAPTDDNSPYAETVALAESHNSYIEVKIELSSGLEDIRRMFAFDRDTVPEATYTLEWRWNSGIELRVVASGDEDVASYRFELDANRDGVPDESAAVDARSTTELLNGSTSLTAGELVDITGVAYAKTGQSGEAQPAAGLLDETVEVPALSEDIPEARPTISATPNQSGSTGEVEWTVDDPAGVVDDVQTRKASGRNLNSNDNFSAPSDDSSPYSETVALTESHNSYIEIRLVTSSGIEDVRRLFAFDRDTVPEATYSVEWTYDSGIIMYVVAKGDEDVASYRFGLDVKRNGTIDETTDVDGRSVTTVVNGATRLTPGEFVRIAARAFSETGQAGEVQPADGQLDDPVEVPELEGTNPDTVPTINADLDQISGTPDKGVLDFTVDDPDGVLTQVEVRTAAGRNLKSSDSYSTLSKSGGTYTQRVDLSEEHASFIQVRLNVGGDLENVTRTFSFDADRIPEADYTPKWVWNHSRQTVELVMVAQGDEDVSSYQFTIDAGVTGVVDNTENIGARSTSTLVNPSTALAPGTEVKVTGTAYSETGQSGNVESQTYSQILEVPPREDAISVERPVINAELKEPDSDTGRLEWTVDDPDNVVNSVEVRTKQGGNFDGESFSSPSETNPYAEEVGLVPLHNSYIEVKLSCGAGVEDVRQTYTFDPDDEPTGDITLSWDWTGNSQELTVNYVGDDDVESWKFLADLNNDGYFETEHNTSTDAGAQTINPNYDLSGGDTIGLKVICYTKNSRSGKSKLLFDGTLDVPLPRQEVPQARPTISAETLEPDSNTGRVEWTVDDPDNVVNSVEVRTKQGGNFDGESFSSPSETNPYAEEVGLVPLHNSYIEVRLVTEPGIENIRKLFVFDPDEEPNGTVNLRWRWDDQRTSQELKVEYVGDDDVESWKFLADLNNDGYFETEHNTSTDAGAQTINPNYDLSGGDTIGLKVICYTKNSRSGKSKLLFDGSLDVPLPREEVPETRPSITVEDIRTFRSGGDLFGEVEWTYDDPDGIVYYTEVRVAVGENLSGTSQPPSDDTSPFSETVEIEDKHTSYIEVQLKTYGGYDNVRQVFPFDADTRPEGSVEIRWEYDAGLGGIKGVIVTTGDDDVGSWKFTISDGSNQDTQYVDGQSVTEQLNKSFGLDPGQTVSISADAYSKTGQSGTVNSILKSETFVVMADIDAVADGDGVVIEGKHILLDGATTIDGGLDLFQTGYHHPALKQAIQDGKLIERISFTHPNDVSGTELTGPLNGRRYKFQDGAMMVAGEGPYDVACKIDQSAGSEPRVAVEFSVSSVDPDVAVGGWFKVEEGNTGGVLFSMDASEYFRVYVAPDGNLKVNDNLGSSDFDTGTPIDDGRWHHIQIAYVKQGSTRILVYIDGSIYVNEDVSGSLGSGNARYLMVGRGSEATAYDGPTGGGGQITFYCQDLFCYKGGNWDNDYAVPMAANPDQFAPIGRVHGDLLVEDTVRAEVVDAEQLFTETFILQAGGVITNNASPKDFRVNNDGFEINAQDTGSGANSFDIIDFGTDTIYGFLTGSSNTVLLSALNSATLKLASDGKTRIETDSGQFVEIISDYLQVNEIKGVGANAPVQLHEGMKVGANPVQFEWENSEKGMVFRDARSSQPSNSEMDALLNPLEMFLYLVEDPDEGGSDIKLQFFEKKSDGTVAGPDGFGAD